MSERLQMLRLGSEELPQDWAAKATYHITHSNSENLLVIADGKDDALDLLLFRKNGDLPELIGQRCVPFSFSRAFKGKLTGAIIRQLQLAHKQNGENERHLQSLLSYLFVRTDAVSALLQDFGSVLQNQGGYSIKDLYRCISKLADIGEVNFQNYTKIFRNYAQKYHDRPADNPLYPVMSGMLLELELLLHTVRGFLEQHGLYELSSPSFAVWCGSNILKLSSLADPTLQENAADANNIFINSETTARIYTIMSAFLAPRSEEDPHIRLSSVVLSAYPYAEKLMLAYQKYSQQEHRVREGNIPVYNNKMFILPADAGIRAGSSTGKLIPFSGINVHREDGLLIAPFSEDFSALIAAGEVVLLSTSWELVNNGWKFETEFTYRGKKLHPEPRIYTENDLCRMPDFPTVVLFRYKDDNRMHLYSVPKKNWRVSLYRGIRENGTVQIAGNTDTYYFRITDGNGFVGQVTFRRAKEGNGNG